jgi:hypothetical protein
MKAKILSATPKEYNKKDGTKGTLYHVVADNGKIYTCFSDRVKEKIGQEVEFEEVGKLYNNEMQYTMNLPKEAGSFQGKQFKQYGKSPEEAIVGAKCMVLSYCKDLVVACTGTEVLSVEQASESLISAFKKVWVAIGIENDMKAKITPTPASTGAISGQEPHHTLRASLVTILHAKMKKNNYRSKDMIDVAAAEGIELKYDASSDGIIWLISEDEANKLINLLE